MSNSRGNYNYRPVPSNNYGDHHEDPVMRENHERMMEQQNDAIAIELANKVSALKNLTRGIHEDVVQQNSFLDSITQGFDGAGGLLGGSMNRLKDLSNKSGGSMLYLIGFCCLMFMVLYFLMR